MSFYKIDTDFVTLSVKAMPNSQKNEICSVEADRLKIKIHAAPEDGKANSELIAFLAKEFKISKSDIEVISGASSRQKLLRLPLNNNLKKFLSEKDEQRTK